MARTTPAQKPRGWARMIFMDAAFLEGILSKFALDLPTRCSQSRALRIGAALPNCRASRLYHQPACADNFVLAQLREHHRAPAAAGGRRRVQDLLRLGVARGRNKAVAIKPDSRRVLQRDDDDDGDGFRQPLLKTPRHFEHGEVDGAIAGFHACSGGPFPARPGAAARQAQSSTRRDAARSRAAFSAPRRAARAGSGRILRPRADDAPSSVGFAPFH
jgi:hypothetical protein